MSQPEDTNVIDLMAALPASLAAKDKAPAKAEPKTKAAKPTKPTKPAATAKPKSRKDG